MTQLNQDDVLLTKINAAVKAMNESEKSVTTAQAEHVSRSKTVGLLLLDVKKKHPKVKDFEAYLNRVDGLKLSRAYDCLRLAGGRTTDEELRKEARERQQKSRAKKKKLEAKSQPCPKPEPRSEPKPDDPEKVSVTVTETAQDAQPEKEKAAAVSARSLREFEYACRFYLPKLNEADLKKAHAVSWKPIQNQRRKRRDGQPQQTRKADRPDQSTVLKDDREWRNRS